MAANTGISWTDETDQPIVKEGGGWYCEKVSPGCEKCYAELMNRRFDKNHMPYMKRKPGDRPELKFRWDILDKWRKAVKPKRVFVSSVTDIFADFVPTAWKFNILKAMCHSVHTFQILTKRMDQDAVDVINSFCILEGIDHLPSNIWVGTSIENQKYANIRIPFLLQIKCQVRFLSCEPLLGQIDFYDVSASMPKENNPWRGGPILQGIHWVIVGGESGMEARPMHPNWVILIQDQCSDAGVAFFFKQWGTWLPFQGRTQQSFHTDCSTGIAYDGPIMNMINPINDKPGNFMGGKWMDCMEAFSYCREHRAEPVSFLRKKSEDTLYGSLYQEFPKIIK